MKKVPDRIGFDPMPWESFAIWIMTQMQRWGQVKGDVDYQKIAQDVFLATDARRAMEQAGLLAAAPGSKKIVVMGKVFDSNNPREYLDSFAIKRACLILFTTGAPMTKGLVSSLHGLCRVSHWVSVLRRLSRFHLDF